MSTEEKKSPPQALTDGGKAIVRAAYEKAWLQYPIHRGTIEAAIERVVDALKTNRLDLFVQAGSDLRAAAEALDRTTFSLAKTLDTLEHVEPAAFVNWRDVIRAEAVKILSPRYKAMDQIGLATEYVTHRMQCTDKQCAERDAMESEMRRRGLEVPR